MADSKNIDKNTKRSKVNDNNKEPDEERPHTSNEDAAEKTDAPKDFDDFTSSSEDSIWPTINLDASSNDSDKQKELIHASRKRFREEIFKVINRISPGLSSLVMEPIESDESETADVENVNKEQKKKSEEETSVVPAKKHKKK